MTRNLDRAKLFSLAVACTVLCAAASGQADSLMRTISTTGAIYGSQCGFAGADPAERIMIEELIAERNIAVIGLWLRRKDPGIKAYAAEALLRLERVGLPMPFEERSIIDQMRRSDEKITTCSGCTHLTESLKTVMARMSVAP